MIEGKKVLALITARGGSKGIPDKNIRPLAGKPLIQWTIDAAKKSKYIDRLVLSTDSERIANIAADMGCEVPFMRPAHLATDEAGSISVILHALDEVGDGYDYLLLLQPTSPFRTAGAIDGILEFATARDADAVVSVARLKKHPMYMYEISEGRLKPFLPSDGQLRRQDMPPAYEHNGALYVARTDYLRAGRGFNDSGVLAYITEGRINLDIDTVEDWAYAEFLLSGE